MFNFKNVNATQCLFLLSLFIHSKRAKTSSHTILTIQEAPKTHHPNNMKKSHKRISKEVVWLSFFRHCLFGNHRVHLELLFCFYTWAKRSGRPEEFKRKFDWLRRQLLHSSTKWNELRDCCCFRQIPRQWGLGVGLGMGVIMSGKRRDGILMRGSTGLLKDAVEMKAPATKSFMFLKMDILIDYAIWLLIVMICKDI